MGQMFTVGAKEASENKLLQLLLLLLCGDNNEAAGSLYVLPFTEHGTLQAAKVSLTGLRENFLNEFHYRSRPI